MKKKILPIILTLFFMLALTATAFAAPDDSTLSQHIKEADGTSGQDTNSGSGVKTNHLQDGAVTTSKIAAGAITDSKIAGPISASKIQSAGLDADTVDGLHSADFAPSSHGHYQSDIVGLEESLTGKADVNHNHDGVYQKKYAGVTVVAKSGGDYADPVTALGNISTWCGTPSISNPCLIKIMPGVYEILPTQMPLHLFEYVILEGSGTGLTKIRCYSDGSNDSFRPAISIGCNDKIKDITIEMIGDASTGKDAVAFHSHCNPQFVNVDIYAINGNADSSIKIMDGGPSLNNVTIYTNGMGISTYGSDNGDVVLEAVKIKPYGVTISYGIYNAYKELTIKNSEINGGIYSPNTYLKALNTQLTSTPSGPAKLVNCYDAAYNPIPNQ